MASYGMKGPYEGRKSGNYKIRQTPNFTPEQMDLFGQGMGNVGPESYLARLAGGDESMFAEMEAPALKQFSGIQGGIASRFSGAGMGARNSSGFQNTMNQAGADFAQQLQANRQALQRQAIMDLHGMSQDLLNQRPYDTRLEERGPKKEKWWSKALPYAGAAVGGAIGGPAGAYTGYQAGQMGRSMAGGGGGQPTSFSSDLPSSWRNLMGGGGGNPGVPSDLEMGFRSGAMY